MRGRVALSDPEIVRKINENYIPAIGEHGILTRGPLSDWWNQTVPQANPQYRGGSTQGYYVIAADGTGIFWDNYIPRLREALDRGLARYRQSPSRRAEISNELLRDAAPQSPPPGTSVVRLFTRIRPVPAGAHSHNNNLGRDYMWVLADEVREMLSAAEGGQPFDMPRTLVARLVTFHLVDNVRGQVWPYRPGDVSRARFTARPTGSDGQVRRFTFTGDYAKRSSNPPHWTDRGQEGRVEGEFEIDATSAKIVRFRALVESQAWDQSDQPRNFPPPPGRYTLLTAITEANDELAQQITPEPAGSGQYYLRPR